MVTQENWEKFTDSEHTIWKTLFERQMSLLKNRAAPELLQGMEKLKICSDKIPKFSDINKILSEETGFSIIPVKGFLEEDLFFKCLSERKFPSTCFIRREDQLDYLEEPDIFHDIFGHVPLLVNPVFADFMQEFGKRGLESIGKGFLKEISALYWFTVEFGLIKTSNEVKIYGAGIVSSKEESIYSLESVIPSRLKFNMQDAIKTKYLTDRLQSTYFVINNFKELFDTLHNLNFENL